VSKFVKIASMSLFALLAAASLAFGQEGAAPSAVSFSGSLSAPVWWSWARRTGSESSRAARWKAWRDSPKPPAPSKWA